ncbi:MAG TPA: hypothetical protein ENH15_03690, partial [Actinobacteria bacterium]|nr:hypothetical protein [Actinomycetota bacterium]
MAAVREIVKTRPVPDEGPGRLLKTAMMENSLVSGISGLVLVAGASGLDTWLGVNVWVLVGAGVGLIAFGAVLIWWSRSSKWLRLGGRIAVVGDTAWVVGAVLLIAFTDVLTGSGEVALAGVTVIVAGFATAQWIGLRRLDEAG